MKIVCDNCATKYSIADDKVRGKVFKIRCKKCSHIIVVRGAGDGATAGAPAEAPKFDQKETKVFDYSGADGEAAAAAGQAAPGGETPTWHLVIDREQVGPMTADEVRQRFARGECDGETYAWKEGFGDWQKLSAIPDFADLQASAPASGGYGDTARADQGDLFAASGAHHDDGNSDDGLFASAPPTTAEARPSFVASAHSGETPIASDMFAHGGGGGGGLFEAAAPASGGGGGLFEAAAPVAEHHGGGSGGLFEAAPAAPSPRVDASRMTGQRNENSVLFSLSNLQALAVGAQAAPAAQASRPGYASSQTEGSGLIDIRAMAASTLGAPAMPSSGGSAAAVEEELPAFGASAFSPVAAPVLLPTVQSGIPKWVWGLVAGGGLLLVIAIVMLVLIMRRPPPVVVQPAPTTMTPTPAPTPGTTATPAVTAKAEEKKAEEKPAAEEKKESSHEKKVASASGGKHHGKADKEQLKKDLAIATPPAQETPVVKKKKDSGPKAGGDELDALLSGATGGKVSSSPRSSGGDDFGGGGRKSAPSAADENLPDQLRSSDIQRGMASVKGRVSQCYAQYNVPGMVQVTVNITPAGRVSSAQIGGKFAGTPTGDCVARAVKSASFPRFKGPTMSIDYPFMLSK